MGWKYHQRRGATVGFVGGEEAEGREHNGLFKVCWVGEEVNLAVGSRDFLGEDVGGSPPAWLFRWYTCLFFFFLFYFFFFFGKSFTHRVSRGGLDACNWI